MARSSWVCRRWCTVLLVVLAVLRSSDGKKCQCGSLAKQRLRFCQADFVGLVRLLGTDKKHDETAKWMIYTVKVLDAYKGVIPDGNRTLAIHSILDECGVVLDLNSESRNEFLLSAKFNASAGYRLEMDACTWNAEWGRRNPTGQTDFIRKGFRSPLGRLKCTASDQAGKRSTGGLARGARDGGGAQGGGTSGAAKTRASAMLSDLMVMVVVAVLANRGTF